MIRQAAGKAAGAPARRRLRAIMAKKSTLPRRLTDVAETIAVALDVNGCLIWLRPTEDALHLVAYTITTESAQPDTRKFYADHTDQTFVGKVMQAREPVVMSTSPDRAPPDEPWFSSYLGAPIVHDGQVLGAIELKSSRIRAFSEQERDIVSSFGLLLGEHIRNPPPLHSEQRPAARRQKPSMVTRSTISGMEQSREALLNLKELLAGCVASDTPKDAVGNHTRLPISSEALEAIRALVDAGIRVHQSPRISRFHVGILVNVRDALIEYNKTIDVLVGAASRTRKLVWEVSKIAGFASVPIAAMTGHLSSAVLYAITSLEAVILTARTALGL